MKTSFQQSERMVVKNEKSPREASVKTKLLVNAGVVFGKAVSLGLLPNWFAYRGMQKETIKDYFDRNKNEKNVGSCQIVHEKEKAYNPLPCNIESREDLPAEKGWWGYSFYDVPHRYSGETKIATLPNCLVTWFNNPDKGNDYYPAILTGDRRALIMREVAYKQQHAQVLRKAPEPLQLEEAIWVTERVYHNHSHWLTAHLPKLLWLHNQNLLHKVILPPNRTATMNDSLRMLGLDPDDFLTYDENKPLFVKQLTVMDTDRFRPELLRLVPSAYGVYEADAPNRRIFISRAKASRRKLVNEEEIWSLLEPHGFERVFMEELTFQEQVKLMQETSVLMAPHGAGLTNMMFCPPGAQIVEIADLSFPNPNFYALASAMKHQYWIINAQSEGNEHPLEKDMSVNPVAIKEMLTSLI
ncbi:glycosyltransferase family 61 protein [Vreelandella nanhaiensis]|uniref:Glycosyltransferase family 61 protein n=1 Tax=Vreelandella nanhaiensis TaxID=1258546 RepID=A0A3S0WK71_9GAMM|nr:glycosyltransferase family 61 protein [Halomonas nanhaiensis]RUR31310.1 glycosyltransferase family 61 protein [Halomonas nanhaiensis]